MFPRSSVLVFPVPMFILIVGVFLFRPTLGGFRKFLQHWRPVLVHDYAYSVPKPRTLVEVSCYVCGKWLKGRAALTQHLKKAHGLYPYLAHFLPDSTCPVCRKLFSSRARTLQHVCHSSCGAVLGEGSFPLVDLDIFESLNRQDREMFRSGSKLGIHPFSLP